MNSQDINLEALKALSIQKNIEVPLDVVLYIISEVIKISIHQKKNTSYIISKNIFLTNQGFVLLAPHGDEASHSHCEATYKIFNFFIKNNSYDPLLIQEIRAIFEKTEDIFELKNKIQFFSRTHYKNPNIIKKTSKLLKNISEGHTSPIQKKIISFEEARKQKSITLQKKILQARQMSQLIIFTCFVILIINFINTPLGDNKLRNIASINNDKKLELARNALNNNNEKEAESILREFESHQRSQHWKRVMEDLIVLKIKKRLKKEHLPRQLSSSQNIEKLIKKYQNKYPELQKSEKLEAILNAK